MRSGKLRRGVGTPHPPKEGTPVYGYIFAQSFSGNFANVEALVTTTPPGIRYATLLTTGSYALFAAWEGDTVGEWEDAQDDLATAGASSLDAFTGVLPQYDSQSTIQPPLVPPKFTAEAAFEAFVRVGLAPGVGLGFLQAAASIATVIGACVTSDLGGLVEVGATSYEDLADGIVEVGDITGVTVLSTSLAGT